MISNSSQRFFTEVQIDARKEAVEKALEVALEKLGQLGLFALAGVFQDFLCKALNL